MRGFSLIEAAIVLGIVGLVIGGIWVAASAVMENRRLEQASAGTLMIVQNLYKSYHGGRFPSYIVAAEDAEAIFITGDLGLQGGKVDGFKYNKSAGTIDDPWGSSFDHRLGKGIELNENYTGSDYWPIAVEYSVPNVKMCIRLTAMITSAFRSGGDLIGVALPVDSHHTVTTIPYVPTAAECTGTPQVAFIFRAPT